MVRGDICAITTPRGRGRVQHGPRYAVVVQADELLALSTVLVCPTSTSAQPASFHPEITIGDDSSLVLCEMAGAINVRAIGKHVGHLSIEELRAVNEGLELVLDLT